MYRYVFYFCHYKMKQAPWIPAPCKATSKRFRKGNLCARHRRVSFRSVRNSDRSEDKLFVGEDGRIALDRFVLTNGIDTVESPDVVGGNGEFQLLDNLQHIKMLYMEAKTMIEALKREVTICKDEILRSRMDLNMEKEARRGAEDRLETMSSSVRELERVVDAQKDYIGELRLSRKLNYQSAPVNPRGMKGFVTSSDDDGNGRLRHMERSKTSGHQVTVGTMTSVVTADAGVQTVRAVKNQSVQTKTLADRHVQTLTISGETDLKLVQDQLEAERQVSQRLRSKLSEYEKAKGYLGKEKNDKTTEMDGERNCQPESRKLNSRDGGVSSRENAKEIMTTLRKLEEEVGDLHKRLRHQKLVNQALKQYFRILESSYMNLFS